MNLRTFTVLCSLLCIPVLAGHSVEYAKNSNNHVPSLITDSPYEGRLLAIKLVRKTTGTLQTDIAVKPTVRQTYTDDAQLLMHAAKLVAIEFKTIAIANHYWHGEE